MEEGGRREGGEGGREGDEGGGREEGLTTYIPWILNALKRDTDVI